MSVTFDRLLAIDHQDIYRMVLSYPYPIRFDHLLVTRTAPIVGILSKGFYEKEQETYRPKRTKKGMTGLALDRTRYRYSLLSLYGESFSSAPIYDRFTVGVIHSLL